MESNENRNMPEEQEVSVEQTEEQLSEQRQIRREKLQNLRDAGRDPFLNETWDVNAHSKSIKDNFDAMDGSEVSVAGRIMTKRIMGKAAFIDLQDKEGRIQCYVKRDDIGEEDYKWFKTYDIGDIVGIVGDTGCAEGSMLHTALFVFHVPVCPSDLWDNGVIMADPAAQAAAPAAEGPVIDPAAGS